MECGGDDGSSLKCCAEYLLALQSRYNQFEKSRNPRLMLIVTDNSRIPLALVRREAVLQILNSFERLCRMHLTLIYDLHIHINVLAISVP